MSLTDDLALVDHHCHGLVPHDLSPDEFRLLGTESDWLSDPGLETLDSPFGLALRKVCAPVLDLEPHVPVDRYLERRLELGAHEVNNRLMSRTGTAHLLIDSGFLASPVLSPPAMEAEIGIRSSEVVRLERLAEELAPNTTAAGFADAFREALREADRHAVGYKSVIAYRYGFDIEPVPPTPAEVAAAAGEWFRAAEASGSYRLEHPVLLKHLIWEAVQLQKPIQFHTGFGDSDLQLYLADPSRLTKFLVATRTSGAKFLLLHCYPFIREAASLAHIFPHVYCDVGVITHYLGPSATTAIRHVLEIAPFNKVLYSSDAYGLAEHYLVSSTAWRRGMDTVLGEWIADDWLPADEARRIAEMMAAGNSNRIYGLDS